MFLFLSFSLHFLSSFSHLCSFTSFLLLLPLFLALPCLSDLSLSFQRSLTFLFTAHLSLHSSLSFFFCLIFFLFLFWSEMALALSTTITMTMTMITRPVRSLSHLFPLSLLVRNGTATLNNNHNDHDNDRSSSPWCVCVVLCVVIGLRILLSLYCAVPCWSGGGVWVLFLFFVLSLENNAVCTFKTLPCAHSKRSRVCPQKNAPFSLEMEKCLKKV